MSDNKAAWRHFFQTEKSLYEFLNREEHVEPLYGEAPAYLEYLTPAGAVLERPPRFVHCILKLRAEQEPEFLGFMDTLREAFLNAAPNGRLPVRWPSFYRDISQVNVSINTAYSSIAVADGEALLLKSRRWPKEAGGQKVLLEQFAVDQRALKKWGLANVYCNQTLGINPFGQPESLLTLTADTSELLALTGHEGIQARKRTGLQYRARIRGVGQSAGRRVKLGLMVLAGDDEPLVLMATPQAPRPHQLSASGLQITLPIETDLELFGRG